MPHDPYQYAFGDEAGDPGFAFDRGSTRYFAVLLLLLNDPESLRDQVDHLRQWLGLPAHVEFKFSRTSDPNRRSFLAVLEPYSFVGRALVVDKSRLSAEWRRMRDVGVSGERKPAQLAWEHQAGHHSGGFSLGGRKPVARLFSSHIIAQGVISCQGAPCVEYRCNDFRPLGSCPESVNSRDRQKRTRFWCGVKCKETPGVYRSPEIGAPGMESAFLDNPVSLDYHMWK